MDMDVDPVVTPWNSSWLKPPHFEFFESSAVNAAFIKKAVVSEFHANRIRELLFSEMVLLSKFIAQRKCKYRAEKGFKAAQKVIKTVGRVHLLDLKTVTTLMRSNLMSGFVPSFQLCQWLLIKMQSNGLLLNRTVQYCRSSCFMLNHRLRTGHNWIETVLVMAMISRMWSLASYLLSKCFYAYEILITVLTDLPLNPKDRVWNLNHQLPKNLQYWIENPHDIPSFSRNSQISKLASSGNQQRIEVLKATRKIKSLRDLKLFIIKERKLRRYSKERCLSKNLSSIRWSNFRKRLRKFVQKLGLVDDKMCMLKKIRKNILATLLS